MEVTLFILLSVVLFWPGTSGLMPALYPFGEEAGDWNASRSDDIPTNITLPKGMDVPIFGERYSYFALGSNGMFTFNGDFNDYENTLIPFESESSILTIFWVDIDAGDNAIGEVWYRLVDSGPELIQATKDVLSGLGSNSPLDLTDKDFSATLIFVATWCNCTYYKGDENAETVTIQSILITDEIRTFVMYNYGYLGWVYASGQFAGIGYNVGDGVHYHIFPEAYGQDVGDVAVLSNVAEAGRWLMQVNMLCDPDLCSPDYGVCLEGNMCHCRDGWEGTKCSINIEECKSSPCGNGLCVDHVNRYSCECYPGYTGLYCDSEIYECKSDPCVHGSCTDDINGYLCKCDEGFDGLHCEFEINECMSCPCRYGYCSDRLDHFECICDEGYTGIGCDVNINDCKSLPCGDNSVCVDGLEGRKCMCFPGYTGHDCLDNIDECKSSPCFYGHCEDEVNRYHCECDAGFSGINCEVNINDCTALSCIHGKCMDGVGGFDCECDPGWYGERCSMEANECVSAECIHGYCRDEVNGYTCHCIAGYKGHQCEEKIPECKSAPCILGSCIDITGGFVCHCPPGVSGKLCEFDKRPKVGEFGDWGVWSMCTKSCNRGLHTRYRQCLRLPCLEHNKQMQLCNSMPCPVSPAFAEPDSMAMILETYKTMQKAVDQEKAFRSTIAHVLNSYCTEFITKCCDLIDIHSTRERGFNIISVDDVRILSGYPKVLEDGMIQQKFVVRTTTNKLQLVCSSRHRRHDNPSSSSVYVYIPPNLMYDAFVWGRDKLDQDACCWEAAVHSTTEVNTVLMASLIPVAVALLLLIIIFSIPCRSCWTRSHHHPVDMHCATFDRPPCASPYGDDVVFGEPFALEDPPRRMPIWDVNWNHPRHQVPSYLTNQQAYY